MKSPAISVIVPVYNVEAYLARCIDSILAQTFTDFELILVDDGSPDRCREICDEYAAKDSRIRVIHKENGGVSSARNLGIERATGYYVMFCDSDDVLPECTMEKLVDAARSFDGELVVGDFNNILIDVEKNTIRNTQSYCRTYSEIDVANVESLYSFWTQNNMLSAWGKLFIRNIIAQNDLLFNTDLIVMEDYAFVIDYLTFCKRICMIPDVVYHYISMASSSIMKRRSRKDFIYDILYVSEKLEAYISSLSPNGSEAFQKLTIYSTIRLAYDIIWAIETPDFHSRQTKYKRIKQVIQNETFQKMLLGYKNSFGRLEYFFLRAKSIFGILFALSIHRVLSVLRLKKK